MPVFLFTDIENSTRLWDLHREMMARALKRHDDMLYTTIARFGGRVIEHTGDGVYAVFEQGQPLAAVLDIQHQVAQEDWGTIGDLRIRMGLHACPSDQEGLNYFHDEGSYHGPAVNHTARVMSAGWGGQILLTPAVLHFDRLPVNTQLQDLGLHMLKSLTQPQQIYALTHPDLPWQELPELNTLSARPNNLPGQSTPFVGRQEEIEQLIGWLTTPAIRLLTLVGPGGVGKTRLAIQTAAELVDHFNHGVFFVPLASVGAPEHIIPAIAGTLNFTFYGRDNQKLQLLNYLHNKQMLLVIDNFEHLLDGVGLLADLLAAAPQIKILVTCRERLNFAGEKVLAIRGMPLPAETNPAHFETNSAVQLFLNAAHRVQSDFNPNEFEAAAIIRICRLVDGMPLGIELAAAWVRVFTCQEIAEEIERNLNFLTTTRPDLPERHRNLYAVCDYFWEQLSPLEQTTICKMAVFRGGFHRRAARQIAGASSFFLSALVDRSFLRKTTLTISSRPDMVDQSERWRLRYELHEVLRQYALQKLEQRPEEHVQARAAHGRYYADFLAWRESQLKDAHQQAALEQITSEIDNIRAAWRWAISGPHTAEIDQMLEALFLTYYLLSWLEEGQETLAPALAAVQAAAQKEPALHARLLIRQGRFLERLSQSEQAEKLTEEGLALLQHVDLKIEEAHAYRTLAINARARGDFQGSMQFGEKSLAIYRQIDAPWYMANTLTSLGDSAYRLGDYPRARQLYWEGYNLHTRIGDPRDTAFVLNGLGILLNQLGEQDAAVTLLQESIRLNQNINNRWGLAVARHNLGFIASERHDYATARPYLEQSLSFFREIGNQWSLATVLSALGNVVYRLGERPLAKKYLHEALVICRDGEILSIMIDTLVQTALIAHAENETDRAAELLAFSLTHPAIDKAETEKMAQTLWDQIVADRPESATIWKKARPEPDELYKQTLNFLLH